MRCALCISNWHARARSLQGTIYCLRNLLTVPASNVLVSALPCVTLGTCAAAPLRTFERERTFCVVCVTRLQRSWTSIDQHFQGVCTVYSLACGKGADRLSMGKHGHEWARGPGVTDAFLRSLVPECYDIIAESSVGNSNGTVSSAEGQSGPSSGSYEARRMFCAICIPDSSARWRWPALAHASVPN